MRHVVVMRRWNKQLGSDDMDLKTDCDFIFEDGTRFVFHKTSFDKVTRHPRRLYERVSSMDANDKTIKQAYAAEKLEAKTYARETDILRGADAEEFTSIYREHCNNWLKDPKSAARMDVKGMRQFLSLIGPDEE